MKDTSAHLKNEPIHRREKLYFVRMNTSEKRQHLIFMVCFLVLVITGFMVKIPEEIVKRFGTAGSTIFYYRGVLHRIAGTLMILVSLYHVYYLLFKQAGRRLLVDMLPRYQDLKDMVANIFYYFGIKDAPPRFDRFCYKHKLEYGALIAGNTLMSVTGILLWTEYFWTKFVLDIATIVHQMEAILACLAIMVWHLYEVLLKPHKSPLGTTWRTGLIDEGEMQEEFPLHYKKIMGDTELQKIYIKRADQFSGFYKKMSLSQISRIH